MAKSIYKQVDIVLQDGREVTLRPLPISRLRRFMKAWGRFGDVKTEEESFDILIACSGIALEGNFKGDFESLREGNDLSAEYREYLEDVLDIDTIYEIMDVCGGLKLNDPKLQEAAQRALLEAEAAGTR